LSDAPDCTCRHDCRVKTQGQEAERALGCDVARRIEDVDYPKK
jgi:hypothetical protein